MSSNKEYVKKYSILTKDELNSLVQVVSRIFVGNTLVFYLVRTSEGVGYITCDAFETICSNFKVSIDDKSSIKRIGFKSITGFSVDKLNNKSYRRVQLEPTDTSKNDVYSIFPNGIFVYDLRTELKVESTIKQILSNYCLKKYEKEIERDKRKEFFSLVTDLPFVEVFDTYLNEVIGYICVGDNTLISQIQIQIGDSNVVYNPSIRLTKIDVDRLGLNLNIIGKVEGVSQLKVNKVKEYVKIVRYYKSYTFNSKEIRIIFNQNKSGIVSTLPIKYSGILYTSKDASLEISSDNNMFEIFDIFENLRLSGNKWYANNGDSFIRAKPSKVSKPIDNRPVGKFGLLSDAFKSL